jgi:hypothetical protein
MVVNSGNWGFFLQKCLGGWRRGCGGATWKSMIGRADASSWTGACGPGPPVHRGPDQRGKSPFNLGRPRRSDGPGRVQVTGCGGRPARGAAGGACWRGSPKECRERALVHHFARKRFQEEEGKMGRLTRGSEGREEHWRSRSVRGSGGGRRFRRRRRCSSGEGRRNGAG